MCRSWKLWIGLAAGAALIAVLAPNVGASLPLLLVAACPLMMLVMAGSMAGMARSRQDRPPTDNVGELERPAAGAGRLDEPAHR